MTLDQLLSPSEKPNGETACWGHYFNDFTGVLLLLTGSDLASSSSLFGWQQKHSSIIRGGVEDTRLEAKAKDTKKIRGQGQGQPFQGQTLSRPRTGMLEAKAKDQKHKRKCSPKKKRSSQKFFKRSPQKNVFQKIFQALHKILTIQKILLSSSRGQANFRELEAKAKDFKICPRGLHLCQ